MNFKQVLAVLLMTGLCLAPAAFASEKGKARDWHIGIVTGSVSQSEDSFRGAELLVKRYGNSAEGGMITHLTYPDNFMSEMETAIGIIVGLADDPKMRAIVVNQDIPGTSEALKRVRDKRKDILLLVGNLQEDPQVIMEAADLALNGDGETQAYTVPLTAKQLGAKTFVHISFPRHLGYQTLARSRAIMMEVCKDLGLRFADEEAPDPTGNLGVSGAQKYIVETLPLWLEKYGRETAFYCTNEAHRQPLLGRVLELGGYCVGSDSPVTVYPGALEADLTRETDWLQILKDGEEAVVKAGGSGRIATWAYSLNYTFSAALGELARRVLDGEAKLNSLKDIRACFRSLAPGVAWQARYFTSPEGVRSKKLVLICEDTYVFGRGFLGLTETEVPEKYLKISGKE